LRAVSPCDGRQLRGPADLAFNFPDELVDLGGGGLGLQAQDAHLQGAHTAVFLGGTRYYAGPSCATEKRDELAPLHRSPRRCAARTASEW